MRAYTLGHQASYDQALREGSADKPPKKIGMRPPSAEEPDGYPGGWVWWEVLKAEAFRRGGENSPGWPNFAVYELKLAGTWMTDVNPVPGSDGVHNLLKDARVVRRVDPAVEDAVNDWEFFGCLTGVLLKQPADLTESEWLSKVDAAIKARKTEQWIDNVVEDAVASGQPVYFPDGDPFEE